MKKKFKQSVSNGKITESLPVRWINPIVNAVNRSEMLMNDIFYSQLEVLKSFSCSLQQCISECLQKYKFQVNENVPNRFLMVCKTIQCLIKRNGIE